MPVKVGSYGIIGCKGPLVTELAPPCYVCKTKQLEIAHLVAITYYLDVSHFLSACTGCFILVTCV